jgi:hypothetical protein
MAPVAEAAQIAASIEFDAAPRPPGLPEDMQPLPGASLKFLSIKAIDGFGLRPIPAITPPFGGAEDRCNVSSRAANGTCRCPVN